MLHVFLERGNGPSRNTQPPGVCVSPQDRCKHPQAVQLCVSDTQIQDGSSSVHVQVLRRALRRRTTTAVSGARDSCLQPRRPLLDSFHTHTHYADAPPVLTVRESETLVNTRNPHQQRKQAGHVEKKVLTKNSIESTSRQLVRCPPASRHVSLFPRPLFSHSRTQAKRVKIVVLHARVPRLTGTAMPSPVSLLDFSIVDLSCLCP